MPGRTGKRFKECFVRNCDSDSIKTPEKYFFCVPREQATRIRWFKIVRPGDAYIARKHYYCCQDHFDLKDDLVNWSKNSIDVVPRLRKDAIPRYVDKVLPIKKQQVETFNEEAADVDVKPMPPKKTWLRNSNKENKNAVPSTSSAFSSSDVPPSSSEPLPKLRKIEKSEPLLIDQNIGNSQVQPLYVVQQNDVEHQEEAQEESIYIIEEKLIKQQADELQATDQNEMESDYVDSQEETLEDQWIEGDIIHHEIQKRSKEQYSQLVPLNDLPKLTLISKISGDSRVKNEALDKSQFFLQKGFGLHTLNETLGSMSSDVVKCGGMMKPVMVDAACQCDGTIMEDKACSPIKILVKCSESDAQASTSSSPQTLYMTKNKRNELFPVREPRSKVNRKIEEAAVLATTRLINNNPQKYIGIDGDKLQIIEELRSKTGCSVNDIRLTLMKIRMNVDFVTLAREFKISTIQAITIFNTTVGLLAFHLTKYISPPSVARIKNNLPIVFREGYSHVCAVIDALEVDIEKPLDPLKQSWPSTESKKFCALKYLIVCTPDGHISYVSSGFGGDISDISLFRESKILNILPESCGVMINSEFDKNVELVLDKKKCQLISLASSSNSAESGEEFDPAQKDLDTLREISLRYNVEKTMDKIREYRILAPDAGLDLSFMTHVDNIVTIVAGLVNYHRVDNVMLF